MDVSCVLPLLSGLWILYVSGACGLRNYTRATCYVNVLVQALTHVPILANLPVDVWKAACGCCTEEHCSCCYWGIRVASARGHGDSREYGQPWWALQRLHTFIPGASAPKRNQSIPVNANEVSVLTLQNRSCLSVSMTLCKQ